MWYQNDKGWIHSPIAVLPFAPYSISKRSLTNVWINAFSKHVLEIWNSKTYAQFIQDAYVIVSYCSLYITNMDHSMSMTFKRIREECLCSNDGKIETIHILGNSLLNMKHMSTWQVVHVVLSLQSYSSSRKTNFINTTPFENREIVLKTPRLLRVDPNDYEDIMSSSNVYKYNLWSPELDNVCLAKYVSSYSCSKENPKRRNTLCIICSIWYNQQKDT